MILLTKLGGKEILINELLIETAQETPDTVITMNNGHSYIVSEKLDEIKDKIVEFNRLTRRRPGRSND
ncbi:MAG: flagellar FlbD family protein [Oscillospiraceae bacterium]|nr:flagellar FlbD family protein [Oscillospiraceae bacterium]